MVYEITEQQKVGLGLIGFGISFAYHGVTLFFDRGLLALGNILWLAGVVVLIGWYSTLQLFRKKLQVAFGRQSVCSSVTFRLLDGLYSIRSRSSIGWEGVRIEYTTKHLMLFLSKCTEESNIVLWRCVVKVCNAGTRRG